MIVLAILIWCLAALAAIGTADACFKGKREFGEALFDIYIIGVAVWAGAYTAGLT